MKKKLWHILLVLVLLSAVLPASGRTEAADGPDEHTLSYVLLLDVSNNAEPGDDCIAACDMLLDLLPDGQTNIGVIAYGYRGGAHAPYRYTYFDTPREDGQAARQIAALGVADNGQKEQILRDLEDAYARPGSNSPHGQALLAAVDMLMAAGVPEGQGRIIMISDGIRASSDWTVETRSREAAIETAADRNWPIYPIELRYGADGASASGAAQMEEIVADIRSAMGSHQAGAVSTWKIDMCAPTPGATLAQPPVRQLHGALMALLPGSVRTEQPVSGDIRENCVIGNLTSEYLVCFSGTDLYAVTVDSPHTDPVTYTRSAKDGYVTVERGEAYFVVRLTGPTPDVWSVIAHSYSDEKVQVYSSVSRTPQIRLTAKNESAEVLVNGKGGPMERGSSICFDTAYFCRDHQMEISTGDTSVTARLEIQVRGRLEQDPYRGLAEVPMELTSQGHVSGYIPLDSLGRQEIDAYGIRTGKYRARAVLSWEDGVTRESGWFHFSAADILCQLRTEEPVATECPANSEFSIRVSDHILNADNDPLIFTLVGQDGGDRSFSFKDKNGTLCETIQGDPEELTIATNAYLGDCSLVLQVTDGARTYPVHIDLSVTPPDTGMCETEITVYEQELLFGTNLARDVFPFLFPQIETEYTMPVSDAVSNVTLAQTVDGLPVNFAFHPAARCVTLSADAPGQAELCLEVECGAYEKDAYGDYVPCTQSQVIRLKVENAWSLLPNLLIAVGLALLLAGCLCRLLVYISKSCTLANQLVRTLVVEYSDDGEEARTQDIRDSSPDWRTSVNSILDRLTMADAIESCLKSKMSETGDLDIRPRDSERMRGAVGACKNLEPLKTCVIRGVFLNTSLLRLTGLPKEQENITVKVMEGDREVKHRWPLWQTVRTGQYVEVRVKIDLQQTLVFRIGAAHR